MIEKEDGNIVIRQSWDGDKMVSVAEAKLIEGLVPDDFKEFLTRWAEPEVGMAANPILKKVETVDQVEGFDVCKVEIKIPWPLSNRVMINTHYPRLENENGEVIFFFSCIGNEDLKEKYFTDADKKKLVLAT